MKPLSRYFHMVLFAFQPFTKSNFDFLSNFDFATSGIELVNRAFFVPNINFNNVRQVNTENMALIRLFTFLAFVIEKK